MISVSGAAMLKDMAEGVSAYECEKTMRFQNDN